MFQNLIKQRCLVPIIKNSRAGYIRGFWPEPVTQQSLSEFLEEINYFDQPKKLVNIGLKQTKVETPKLPKANPFDHNLSDESKEAKPEKVDELLGLLSREAEAPPLNYDDIRLEGQELIDQAITCGIFRDLFGENYVPDRNDIKFTKEQAKRLDKLIPYHWITDQPFARVENFPKPEQALPYFEPLIGISARFIQSVNDEDKRGKKSDIFYGNTSYYGNIIPAGDALSKPSITLDGKLLSDIPPEACLKESQFNNWTEGGVELVNFSEQTTKYYSVLLLNLDYLHEHSSNLHWMLTNIHSSKSKNQVDYEEVCSYLPVHGISGFGYSRYVFLVFQHESKLPSKEMQVPDFSLQSRKFDTKSFISKYKNLGLTPVGLSWFQTTWDITSNNIFHNYVHIKAPVYEHVQAKYDAPKFDNYPGRVPFNIFLDHERDKKDINEQVLLERLKSVDPFDYKDQYVPPRVPPTVFADEKRYPHWMTNVLFKKKNKIGYWRGLRPASASLPLDNNADLDYPIRPVESSKKSMPERPNLYPGGTHRKRSMKPVSTKELEAKDEIVFIQDDHDVHLAEVSKIMKEFEATKPTSASSNKKKSKTES